ncbi:hypothetical protein SAMD00019534_012750 [Acytostelium subglobosum LB1]|uniref:hypothetical protein n=1 Tax=Acytostelium subglobosum LB1 TaxID=1410327 RepID=UPI000644DCAF|nr:hypothetical protein SAMD00019534_012750 [Acytostelium subglobosum LB1]GAM18100.1 hypothetical protein SAMD00019534_012750 [Acytostelium subglobosum LB1]|eukprot:XP_012758696.1 hypothetical protein SAMD00019534_012750 [Acytostelium subglobosum LB1]
MTQWFTGLTLSLFLTYLAITLVVAFQIGRIIYNKHKKFSWRSGFLLLGFLWGALRTVFWLTFGVNQNQLVAEMLFSIPINIQFATFSLLVLFYAHVVHRSTWETSTKAIFSIAYISINVLLFILQCVWIAFDYKDSLNQPNNDNSTNPNPNPCQTTDTQLTVYDQTAYILTGVVFLLLVSILAFYGWRLNFIIKSTKSAQLQSQLPISIIPITFIIFLCFTSRCIFNFISAVGSIPSINLDCDSVKQSITVFLSYFFWEILPYILILVLFWRIPSTQIGGLSKRSKTNLTFPQTTVPGRVINHQSQPGALARLFLDPQRYDSDDETTTLLYKNSPSAANMYNAGRNSPYSTTPIEEDKDQQQQQQPLYEDGDD